MYYKISIIALSIIFFAIKSSSQTLKGEITDITNKPLPGANIYWLKTQSGTVSDNSGEFILEFTDSLPATLIISFVGFINDTVLVKNKKQLTIQLKESKNLTEVEIKDSRPATYISRLEPVKIEVITQKELAKAACCDLAGCFSTNSNVQASVTNVITNSKELKILGLSGIYNQLLVDGMPLLNGLSYTYGVSSYPGALVKNIWVSKGANSVLQGYEPISGQINVILKEPGETEIFFLNLYVNSFLEKQINSYYSFNRKSWKTLTGVHAVLPSEKMDNNKDSFLDHPLQKRLMFYQKTRFGQADSTGFNTTLWFRYILDKKTGGQLNFDPDVDKGSKTIYGQLVTISQPDIYLRSNYRLNEDNNFFISMSSNFQNQNSWFGEVNYKANQSFIYSNLQYELVWREKHNLKTGFSHRYLKMNEDIRFNYQTGNKNYKGKYTTNENIPGIFAENIFHWNEDKLLLITGVRNDWYKQQPYLTPRSLIKIKLGEGTDLRFSIGKGWRTVKLFSENVQALSSQRDILVTETLRPEQAWNYGTNLSHLIAFENWTFNLNMDFYRTQFVNQVFADYDSIPLKVVFYNFSGESVSNGFQTEVSIGYNEIINLKTAYNFLEVYRVLQHKIYELPFNSKHKLLSTLSIKTRNNKWHLDVSHPWYGRQKLPNTSGFPQEYKKPEYSTPYSLLNIQLTRNWKFIEIYTGCENIFNFTQHEPILSWNNPFGPYFDTSSVWGPVSGREFYVGVRYKIL